MRPISAELQAKFESALQTAAANADPRAILWLSRPTVPLTTSVFLDRAAVLESNSISALDVAVRRPQAGREADRVYLAYVDENGAHVVFSPAVPRLADYMWQPAGFSTAASDVAVAFDGTMPKAVDGSAQFVTEAAPWVFWISGGVLKARKLGLLGDVTLAAANAEHVSAIRATWAPATNVDFGLVCFFTLQGVLYYRQLIGGEWRDAELVTFGPPGVTWQDIRAFRTWDYRVGVQGLGSDGVVYELFTSFQGLGKHGGEHIELETDASGSLLEIQRRAAQEREHLSLGVTSGAPYGGLYRTGAPQLMEAFNADDGNGDWGKNATFSFDRHLVAAEVAAQPTAFHIIDAQGGHYVAQTAALADDGMTVRLTFLNFNGAQGVCQAAYVPGSVHSMAGAALTATSASFTPRNLVPPAVPAPAVVSVSSSGNTQITVRFSAALIGSLSGAASHFSAAFQIPVWSPGGALQSVTRVPSAVAASDPDTVVLTFPAGNQTDLGNAVGTITLTYDGAGPLTGEGGPVYPFSETLVPAGLTPKYDSDDAEHIELSAAAAGVLTRIYRRSGYGPEHIELSVTASGVLTNVKDL